MYFNGCHFTSNAHGQNMDTVWANLKSAFEKIQKKTNSKFSFEQLYRNAYNMILHNSGQRLYSGLRDLVSEHLKQNVRQVLIGSIHNHFLAKLNQAWNDHQTSMLMIRDIVMYMDRHYVTEKGLDNVFDLGIKLFRDEIIKYMGIKSVISAAVTEMIQNERCGEAIDHLLIKNVCEMLSTLAFNTLSLYEEVIETPFLAESIAFYKLEAQKMLAENNASIYINKAEACIQAESARTVLYLDKNTQPHIIEIIENELIRKHMRSIVELENCGLVYMINNSKMDDILTLYKLFSRFNEEGLNVISETTSAYLLEQGRMLVTEQNMNVISAVTFIQKILNLKKQFDELLHYSFNDDVLIKVLISTAFEHLINLNEKSPECLSLFINNKLATGAKQMSEQEIETVLNEAMYLLKLLSEKDAFERYYQLHLAKRLLLNKYVSDDFEKNIISRLKIEYGSEFTLKLERMFKDTAAADTIMNEYKEHMNNSNLPRPKVELEMHVLTMGYWPINPPSLNCNIPLAASETFGYFINFFLNQRSGRKLVLQPQLGSAFINAEFYGRKVEKENFDANCTVSHAMKNIQLTGKTRKHLLQVSTYQMTILMLFNNRETLTYLDIQQETDIPEKKLIQSLESLCMPKQRILVRKSKIETKDIHPTDEFYVNETFVHKFTKVKIQTVAAKDEIEAERIETRGKVDEERKHETDAAIVRTMKERRQMVHNQLVAEVTAQLKTRFLPSPVLIKKRIENLIEREYLERTPQDKKTYLYVA